MKIGLNATCFNDRPSGAKQRFIGLYSELIKRMPETEFVVFEPADCAVGRWFGDAVNVTIRHTPIPSTGRVRKFVAGFGYWSSILARENLDILEDFDLPVIAASGGRTFLTIHDIRSLHAKAYWHDRAVYRAVAGHAFRVADRVITVSETMRRNILEEFPRAQVSVIYNGIDDTLLSKITENQILNIADKYTLPREFIMTVGHLEQRKNHLSLIDAIAKLRDRGNSCFLLIVGNDSGTKDSLKARIENRGLSSHIKILSQLPDIDVFSLYRLAKAFIFPSTYEGFGIPILEAMAADCPLVLSDIPVFRELTEGQAVYFPPIDVDAMALAIEKVLTSSSERDRLLNYGRKRIGMFKYSSLAAQLEDLYLGGS